LTVETKTRTIDSPTGIVKASAFVAIQDLGSISSTCLHKAFTRKNTSALNSYFTNFPEHSTLKVTPNFYAQCSIMCPRNIGVNLLTQKLLIER